MPQDQEIAELIADVKEQVLFMQELGVETLNVELQEHTAPPAQPRAAAAPARSVDRALPPERPAVERTSAARTTAGSRLSTLPSLPKRKPSARPISVPMPIQSVSGTEASAPAGESMFGAIAPTLGETADTIESIRAEIGDCTRCPLSKLGRKQIVHSTGNFGADLMFVGEAPGADEDEQGFPFVGRAGQLLTKIIEGIGLKREDVFIGNINRCRPPGNRAPEPEETAQCRPFILREVAVVRPKVIVVLGATAAHNLLQVKTPISKLRGSFHDYFGVKVMPTFHPAYLLRDPHKKREVWEDMKMVRELLNSPVQP